MLYYSLSLSPSMFFSRDAAEAAEADDDSKVRMQPSNQPEEMSIAQDPNHTPLEGDLDFEEASDETLEAQAKWNAQQALLASQQRTKTFDEDAKEQREQASLNQGDCMSLIRRITTVCSFPSNLPLTRFSLIYGFCSG